MNDPANAVLEAPPVNERASVQAKTLWKRYHQQGSATAEEELVIHYLPLVKTIVGRMAMHLPGHVRTEDLQSAGLLGLLQALRSYDPTSTASFETYARNRIRGAMLDELRRLDWVPRSVHEKSRRIEKLMIELEQRLGRLPTDQEMAGELKITVASYQQWLVEVRPATFLSLDTPAHGEDSDSGPLYEGVIDSSQEEPSDSVARGELVALIRKRLDRLPEMQRKVLCLYYLEDLRLKEIAELFGVTESRICQIHTQAVLSLRAYLRKCGVSADQGDLVR